MPEFALQFAIDRVPEYARYPVADDEEALAIGRAARDRGHYALVELRKVCRWKTPRSTPLVAQNEAELVESQTCLALNETSGERERLEALRSLRGVEWATASVLLHLAYPERYPILDKRALHALGVRPPSAYSFRFWEAYVAACLAVRRRGWRGRANVRPGSLAVVEGAGRSSLLTGDSHGQTQPSRPGEGDGPDGVRPREEEEVPGVTPPRRCAVR
jgi:hypothetical protein